MKIIIPAYSKTYWCLKPFTHLFNKYWDRQDAVILYYEPIPFELPDNFELFQVHYKDYPKDQWADGIIKYLKTVEDNSVVLMLEDYWLTRKVNHELVVMLSKLMRSDKGILRIDLTTDRLYAGGMRDVGYLEWVDLVEAPNSMYQMSLQAGLWNRKNLLDILDRLRPTERSSWSVELTGTGIVNEETEYRVLGTRQYPVRYENGVNAKNGVNKELKTMCKEDRERINQWIEDK